MLGTDWHHRPTAGQHHGGSQHAHQPDERKTDKNIKNILIILDAESVNTCTLLHKKDTTNPNLLGEK